MVSASNGSVMRYVPDFATSDGGFSAGIVYTSTLKAFILQYTMAYCCLLKPKEQHVGLIYMNLTAKTVLVSPDDNFWHNIIVTPDQFVTIGSVQYGFGIIGKRVALANMSVMQNFLYGDTDYNSGLIGGSYDIVTNQVFATGYSAKEFTNLPTRSGSGQILTISWNMQNGSV